MGCITIFSVASCPHCLRTKAALKERDIPYTEISLTSHPLKRADMLALSDRLTVPQVFFNNKHVGGADDTIEVLKKWDESDETPRQHYVKEIEAIDDALDERLALPTTPAVVESPPPDRPDEKSILLPNGSKASVLEVTEKLKQILPAKDLTYHLVIYKKSFRGNEGTQALLEGFDGLKNEDEAENFGRELNKAGILHHVVKEHDFKNTKKYFYRLQCYQEPDVLNSYRLWTERVDEDAMALLKRLKKMIGEVESVVTNNDGDVDYKNAHKNEVYTIFEEAVCELQKVDMGEMDDSTKLAFGINLYNMMIKYAFMKVGIGKGNFARLTFFGSVKMNIGGDLMSFNDLENGVMRSNRKPPYSLSLPFGPKDPRLRLAMKEPDCRIHFGLNCGAKSCPPVKNFTVEAIQEELRIVALAFCETDDNVKIDESKYSLSLSAIFNWYRIDFAESNSKLPEKVVGFLRRDRKDILQRMIDSGKRIKIKFLDYNWDTNASEFVAFDSSVLKPNESQVQKAIAG